MKSPIRRWRAARVFIEGGAFWCAASGAVAYLPTLAEARHITGLESSAVFAGAAIGRTIAQPLAGMVIRPPRAHVVRAAALLALILSSVTAAVSSVHLIIIASRVLEGFGLAFFVVSWRTTLNSFSGTAEFESINESYVTSQGAGRLVGPAIGGVLAGYFGVSEVFFWCAALYGISLIARNSHRRSGDVDNVDRGADVENGFRFTVRKMITWPFIVYHLEFFSLGLWLVVWPIYLRTVAHVSLGTVGFLFSLSAFGGLLWPLVRRITPPFSVKIRLISGLVGIAVVSVLPAVGVNNVVPMSVFMVVSGLSSGCFFTAFHRYMSERFELEEIPKAYGLLGSSTFILQAVGQGAAPFFVRYIGATGSIVINALVLTAAALILFLSGLTNRARAGERQCEGG
jgi:MFS family permease